MSKNRPKRYCPDLFATLREAREWLYEAVEAPQGAICPCCDRPDNIYKRNVSKQMVTELWSLYKVTECHGRDYYHNSTFCHLGSMEYGKLKHIGLLGPKPSEQGVDQKSSGMWAITDKGIAFCQARLPVPRYFNLYHDELIYVSDELRMIYDIWPEFSYNAIFRYTPWPGDGDHDDHQHH